MALPIRDESLPSVFATLNVTLRRVGGVPTYVLTDNEKTVTVEHAAESRSATDRPWPSGGITALTVHTCEAGRLGVQGGSENTVKLVKADLVPTATILREQYASFGELELACVQFCNELNARVYRVTGARR